MNDNAANAIGQYRTWLTALFCNALARCCAPSAPISLFQTFNVVSAYVEWWERQYDRSVEQITQCIVFYYSLFEHVWGHNGMLLSVFFFSSFWQCESDETG